MAYAYAFDSTHVGNFRFSRSDYEIVQRALCLLRDDLGVWNSRALEHGAVGRPYESEVTDLSQMIEWADEELLKPGPDIVVSGISVGSLRYIKAALVLMIRTRERDRREKAGQGWPGGALRSLDGGIDRVRRLAERINYEPSDVLWETTPKEEGSAGAGAVKITEWDVFLSHASEDKEDFARPLAQGLRERGLKVWFDEFTLAVGDSLRRSIDRGLAHSRFGVVVISSAFLRKEWPQKELDGLVAREVGGVKVILPVWHKINADQIRRCSPTLADRLAASSESGLDQVISDLVRAIRRDEEVGQIADSIAAPSPAADVRVTLRDLGRTERFVIENLGPAIARDVHFEIDTRGLKELPLIKSDCREKLPIEILRPGARVELIAALSFGTGTVFRAKWWWREENGYVEQREEKVSLQSW